MTTDSYRPDMERRYEALFDRVVRMTDTELRLLRLAWNEGDADARSAAWDMARSVISRRRRQELLEDARVTLSNWSGVVSSTPFEFGPFVVSSGSGMNPTAVRRDAIPPILDAIAAIVAADGLEESDRGILMEPFSRLDQEASSSDA